MRVVIMACALLWSGLAVGTSPASPKVVMSDKLRGTEAGRIVQRWLEGYVGKTLEHMIHVGEATANYSKLAPELMLASHDRQRHQATIEQIIVPDIADYLSTGDQSKARFKAKFGSGAVMEFKDLSIFKPKPDVIGTVGHIQYLAAEKLAEKLGESYLLARLLAESTDENGDIHWHGLIEIKKDADGNRQEIDPVVVLLSDKEDFMEFVAY